MPYSAKIRLIPITFILFLVGTLTACGGGDESATGSNNDTGVVLGSSNTGNSDDSGNGSATVQGVSSSTSVTISGNIVDGPVVGAAITVTDAHGQQVATVYSNHLARYSVNIPAGTTFPLMIASTGGTDLVTNAEPSFNMVSTVMSAAETTANINPFSTLIVKTAQKMPSGLTPANITAANRNILASFNSGLDTSLVPNPITIPVTEQNVTTLVRSSEVLAEIIRRNYSALSGVNTIVTQNTLIESLAADMTDGVLDGRGTSGADLVVSATATVASGQVLIEALSNSLQVNDEPITSQLDDSIQAIMPAVTTTTEELPVNMEILQNAQTALAVAALIVSSPSLADIQSTIATIETGSTVQEVAAIMEGVNSGQQTTETSVPEVPQDSAETISETASDVLDEAIASIVGSTETEEVVLEQVLTTVPAAPVTEANQTPYGGTPWSIPGRIEAEQYDEGGAGIAYSDTTLGNAGTYLRNDNVDIWVSTDTGGGHMVGTTKPGEWLEYTVNVTAAGAYLINLRVASADDGKQMRILVDGIDVTGAIAVPNTGGWQTWQTVSKSVQLGAGQQVLRVQIDNGSFNLNAIEVIADNNIARVDTSNAVSEIGNTTLMLTWKPNAETVDGYLVYFGTSSDTATTQLSDIKAFSGGFDFSAPAIGYDSWHDLGLEPGQNVCFKLKAYNADGLSNWSQTVCGAIPQTEA